MNTDMGLSRDLLSFLSPKSSVPSPKKFRLSVQYILTMLEMVQDDQGPNDFRDGNDKRLSKDLHVGIYSVPDHS